MKKRSTIYTCYGCPHYYKDEAYRDDKAYPSMHCGQDYIQCPYYLGTGEPLGKKEKENGMS